MTELNINREVDLISKVIEWIGNGNGVAVATVIATWGSSPRPIGSQLVVNDREEFFLKQKVVQGSVRQHYAKRI